MQREKAKGLNAHGAFMPRNGQPNTLTGQLEGSQAELDTPKTAVGRTSRTGETHNETGVGKKETGELEALRAHPND